MPEEDAMMPDGFWEAGIARAWQLRKDLELAGGRNAATDCFRLVHGEGDSLPGLVVDIYGDVAVMQAHSAGMYLSSRRIAAALLRCCEGRVKAVYNKSEGTAPHRAGLTLADGYITDPYERDEAIVLENGHRFMVNWTSGQKTGFFLDQRDNRALVGDCSHGRRVLNLFCYTGGFSVYALGAGAVSVVSVDSSATAVEMLCRNVEINTGTRDAFRASILQYAVMRWTIFAMYAKENLTLWW